MFFKKNKFYHILISAIAVIMIWRGIWNLLDVYLLPDNMMVGSIISVIGGIILLYAINRNLRDLR